MNDAVHYDAIIIGAGQGGSPLSTALANAGLTTAVIEREHVGGTCINTGCTPTKTMVASARVAHVARRAADYGVNAGPVSVEMAKVRQRKRDIVESFRGGSQKRLDDTDGLDLVMGTAAFVGEKTLEVSLNDGGSTRMVGEQIFINTGTRPSVPRIEGLESVSYLDSTSIMELDEVPEHLLVLGGGYVGLEFAQMFRRFGSEVTIIQRGRQVLPREDADIAREVVEILRSDGIEVLLETQALSLKGGTDGSIRLSLRTSTGETERFGTHLLLAVGRVPNTGELNLPAAGVELDTRAFVKVNERLETSAPGIFALGDVKGGPAFTHISFDDFRVLRSNLLEGGNLTIADRLVPYTVFIDPQLGRAGITEQEARHRGYKIKVATMPMSHVARALEVDEPRGLMKAVVDAGSGQILGCSILGMEGGELAAVVQVAMMGRVPYTCIRDGVFAHPTLAESLNNLFSSL
jgi:pyruvate/2-oxoglutarate dehydrogenase complex dihydrolipoamide dehydrogenase (E3) component